MKRKCIYLWSLFMAMLTITACSSDQNEDASVNGKTGTFELRINFEAADQSTDAAARDTRASTAIPATSWSNIKQIQFILYDATGKITFSDIKTPANGTTSGASRVYTYATVPAGTYVLVALANAQSGTDSVTTYASGTPLPWTVANVYNRTVGDLSIGHKAGSWGAAITDTQVSDLTAYTQPSEIFMGYATVTISSVTPATATISLKREVSLMRVRIDQTTNGTVASNVDFTTNAKAAVMLYNLPDRMGIEAGNTGGIRANSTATDALSADGAFSTTAQDYLEGNYTSWKEVVVFPNNGGRTNDANTTAQATDGSKYFIVLCGIAKANHYYAGSNTPATVGAPVFWYGQINEVFTPNVIREVNLVLKTGGSPIPPPKVVEFGDLDITVSAPEPWNAKIEVSTVEVS